MKVYLTPASVTSATVVVDGRPVGTVARVAESEPFLGYDGETHVGNRWLPKGKTVPADVPGPVTRNEAALLLLALNGFDHAEAAQALNFGVAV